MKPLIIFFLFINVAFAQNFSPYGGAGIQSPLGTIGDTSVTSPSLDGAGNTTSPANSGSNNFTSPSATLNDRPSTSGILENQSAAAPTLVPDLSIGPIEENASILNQSPNPLPGEINNSDAFDRSLIQAEEALPLSPSLNDTNQIVPDSTNGPLDSQTLQNR